MINNKILPDLSRSTFPCAVPSETRSASALAFTSCTTTLASAHKSAALQTARCAVHWRASQRTCPSPPRWRQSREYPAQGPGNPRSRTPCPAISSLTRAGTRSARRASLRTLHVFRGYWCMTLLRYWRARPLLSAVIVSYGGAAKPSCRNGFRRRERC
jgi:hypothetical protein